MVDSIVAAPSALDRLPFTLPDFTRHSWVSERARLDWEPRIARICRAWADVEWLSILDGVRRCALVGLAPSVVSATIPRWSSSRLSALGLPLSEPVTHPGMMFIVVGALDDVKRAREAWTARDDESLGCLLGYPECCRRFFRNVWVEQKCLDTTWAMAANTLAPVGAVVDLESGRSILANILWRWIGVRAVPHLPCHFDCVETVKLAERLLAVAERGGFAEEVQWIKEILSWPVEWSALHGIAEVKTPILKISTRTDATASKFVVRWRGTGYPQGGGTGLRFPYQASTKRFMTEGRGFQLGLRRPLEKAGPEQPWLHADNGFSSRETMERLHRPIVTLARRRLNAITGNVLDLGCGNAALLEKICAGQDGLTPYGVDTNSAALEHARALLPRFVDNFSTADIFHGDVWRDVRRYALTLLMPGRLLEVEPPVAERLMKNLRAMSDVVLVYSYPGAAGPTLASLAQKLGLDLSDQVDGIAALLAP